MANPEHVAVVQQGKEAIDEWRRLNPGLRLDLGGADLDGADLAGANLSEAGLADTRMSHVDLRGSLLTHANLSGTALVQVRLTNANLAGATLIGLFAAVADLTHADLSRTILGAANLAFADLSGANLTGAMLRYANLNNVELGGTNLSEAALGWTSLAHLDLSRAIGLATVRHDGPSSVGVDTLIASFRGAGNKLTPELEVFFRGAGVPDELLKELPRLVAGVKYYTCFICYGQPDLGFAKKLCQDLEARGVSCWLYEMDKTPGERTWLEIGRSRREADKMVVLCSAKALVRDGVLKEIEEQIDEDPEKIVPVSLDPLWMEAGFKVMRGTRDLKPFLTQRNYADFSKWESDPEQYQKALDDLLKGLRRQRG